MTTVISERSLSETLARTLTGQWDELLRLRLCVLEEPQRDTIHDLRVTSRRVRTVIGTLVPLLGEAKVRRLQKPIRGITSELGAVRNLDEARHFLLELRDDGLAPLVKALDRRRQRELRRSRRLLRELPYKRLDRRLAKAGAQLMAPHQPDGLIGWLSHQNQTLYRPIRRLLRLERLAALPAERHRLRIAIKKWRYFAELLALLCGEPHSALVERLKDYQTLLGDLNDRELFLAMLQKATAIKPDTRLQAEEIVNSQHRRLTAQFQALLLRQPLTYQCLL